MAGACHDCRNKNLVKAERPPSPALPDRRAMSPKIIVSYDGTANEDDAIALGRLLGRAGGEVSLAYVRHIPQADSSREALAQQEAQQILDRGVALLGDPHAARHVVIDRSTPEGLAALAEAENADVI